MKLKNVLFSFIALLTAISCEAQQSITITGTTSEGTTVYLQDYRSQTTIAKAEVVNGKFTLTAVPTEDYQVMRVSTSEDRRAQRLSIDFICEGTDVTLNLDNNTRSGGEMNRIYNDLMQQIEVLDKRMTTLYTEYKREDISDARREELRTQLNALDEEYVTMLRGAWEKNQWNIVSALVYCSQLYYESSYEELEKLLGQDSPYGKLVSNSIFAGPKASLAAFAKRKPGAKYTDMTMDDVNGVPRKLSEWCGKGNYVLIDFWASWCGPCRQEMPVVVANYQKYHGKGFEVVGVSFDRAKEPWLKAIEQLHLNWIHLSDLKYWDSLGASTYGIRSIPANVLVGPDGTIIANDLRGNALGAKLAEIYGF